MRCFMKRQPNLSIRTANMVKRGRAALSQAEVNELFDHIEPVVEGVPPENIWNYDETNMSDNRDLRRLCSKKE